MKVLVVAAHPDDEVLGCGGTIAKLTKGKHDLWIAILGQGVTSRYGRPDLAEPAEVEALRNASREVGKMLGAKDVFLHDLPDNRFDTVPLLDIVKVLEQLLERVHPDVLYTHHASDLNIDHVLLSRAVLTAARPIPGDRVREIYGFEVPSSTGWAFGQLGPDFLPNVFVDIKQTLMSKIDAMRRYRSEVRTFPHPRSPEAITALAQFRGSAVGLEAAEAFTLVRKLM